MQLCFGFRHFRPSQPIKSEESVCLNLLFVMQVISEEEVSFKVSLFSCYLSIAPFCISLLLVYIFFPYFCDVILW